MSISLVTNATVPTEDDPTSCTFPALNIQGTFTCRASEVLVDIYALITIVFAYVNPAAIPVLYVITVDPFPDPLFVILPDTVIW
jgi:hypothetical protein